MPLDIKDPELLSMLKEMNGMKVLILSDDIKEDIELDSKEIIEKIKEKGLVGMGGATFPTYVKLMPPPGKVAEYLLINGVECEPYLTSDHRLDA